jgi:hypothetical protein
MNIPSMINPADLMIKQSRESLKLGKLLSEQDTLARELTDHLTAFTGAAAGLHENRKRLAQLGVEGVLSELVLMALLGRETARFLPLELISFDAEFVPSAPNLRSSFAALATTLRKSLADIHDKQRAEERKAIEAAADAILKQYRDDPPQPIAAE